MELAELAERAKNHLRTVVPLKVSGVIGTCKKNDGWCVTIELVEREAVPDAQNLLGVYEVVLNNEGQMMGYVRKQVRRRMDLEATEQNDR